MLIISKEVNQDIVPNWIEITMALLVRSEAGIVSEKSSMMLLFLAALGNYRTLFQ